MAPSPQEKQMSVLINNILLPQVNFMMMKVQTYSYNFHTLECERFIFFFRCNLINSVNYLSYCAVSDIHHVLLLGRKFIKWFCLRKGFKYTCVSLVNSKAPKEMLENMVCGIRHIKFLF